MFTDAFSYLPFARDSELTILDVGCGLGFLSCLCAEFYKNARITGIDTFEHSSLGGSSLKGAKENAKLLGFSDRIDFEKSDVLTFTLTQRFELIVSNLVFHNLGKMRFNAYSRLASWTHTDSFVVMGDVFFSPKADLAYLSKEFRIVSKRSGSAAEDTRKPKRWFGTYTLLVMSKDSDTVA